MVWGRKEEKEGTDACRLPLLFSHISRPSHYVTVQFSRFRTTNYRRRRQVTSHSSQSAHLIDRIARDSSPFHTSKETGRFVFLSQLEEK